MKKKLILFLQQNQWQILLLAFLVMAVYVNSLGNAFVSDDIAGIRDNPALAQSSFIFSNPLFFIHSFLYFIFYKLVGTNPLLYRLFNISFHIGNVFLAYAIVYRLVNRKTAFFAASLFAVHPILIESVAWVSGGIYAQYTFFLLASFLIYSLSGKKWTRVMFAAFLFFVALTFSEKAMIFPLILVLYELSFSNIKKHIRHLVPFFALSVTWLGFMLVRFGARSQALATQFYQQRAIDNPFNQIPIAITSYLELIFWPDRLTLYHTELQFGLLEFWIRVFIFAVFVVGTIIAYRKSRQIFFWSSLFFISLLPTLTPLRISWLVAERYVYFGTIGIIVIVAYGLWKITDRKKWEYVGYTIFIALLISLSVRTVIRNIDWKNEDNLWLSAKRTSPSSPQNHNNLGDYYARHGNLREAAAEFIRAIKLNSQYADAYHNLANTYQQMGQIDKAIKGYQVAIHYNSALWESHQNLGAIYFEQKKYNLAETEFKKALEIFPSNPNLHTNLGIILYKAGKKREAKKEIETALQIYPQDSRAQALLTELNNP